MDALAAHINQPLFPLALRQFLATYDDRDSNPPDDIEDCPAFKGKIYVHHSAVACYYAPSDLCGVGGMYRERIRANPSWYGEKARHDTVFVVLDGDQPGMLGMVIARVFLFFSFSYRHKDFSCAFVQWFIRESDEPDEDTGMWIIHPESDHRGQPSFAVIDTDTIARGAHLLPIYGADRVPEDFDYSLALQSFKSFFVNEYVDHHSHEFLSDL